MYNPGWFRIVYNEQSRCFRVFKKEMEQFGPRRNTVNVIDPDIGIFDVYVVDKNKELALEFGKILIQNYRSS